MPRTERRQLVLHKFGGRRFEDADLELAVLPELVAYRSLVVECAKALWRRDHPERERLPRNYEASIVLSFSRLQPGSVVVPIERQIRMGEQTRFWDQQDEVDQAVLLIADAITAAAADRPLPDQFPKDVLTEFETYGSTLGPTEWFEQLPAGRTVPARYNVGTRDRLTHWAHERYEDTIDVIGTVTMVRLAPARFAVRLSEESPPIEAPFEPAAEEVVLDALSHHRSAKVRVRGRGLFGGAGSLARIVQVDDVQVLPQGELGFDHSAPPVWDVIKAVMKDVPDDELAKIPQSNDLDKVVYGHAEQGQ